MTLLQADWVLPVSGAPVSRGAVLVRDGVIAAVGDAARLRDELWAEPVMDLPGCVLMPGLVNAHTHLEYSAFQGLPASAGFGRWMLGLLRARRKLDVDDYAVSAEWGAYQCVRSGVTTIADTTYEGLLVGRAARAAGLRARVCLEVFGLDDSQLPATMQRLEERVDKLAEVCGSSATPAGPGSPPNLIEAGVSPHAPYTVSARLYREVARFARHRRLFLATHLAESRAEVDLLSGKRSAITRAYQAANLWTGQNWTPPGLSPVRHLAGTGALGPRSLAIHVVQADAADIATFAATGAGVAHCPRSNLRLRCGRAPVAEMRAAGIAVGLGTDRLASNDDLDLFAEMRAALAVSRARAAAGAPLPALTHDDVLRMATIDGARALGLDHLTGSIEPGKRADLVAVRLPAGPHSEFQVGRAAQESPQGGSETIVDLAAEVLDWATAADVRMTMIDGRVVFEAGVKPAVPSVLADGFKVARKKLGLAG